MQPSSISNFLIVVSTLQVALFYADSDDKITRLFEDDPYKKHQIWRLVTHLFVHNDSIHLWTNILAQFMLWLSLDSHQIYVAIIYICSGIVGATMPCPDTGLGCSAAIYGLVFAIVADCVLNWKSLRYKERKLFIAVVFTLTVSAEAAIMIIFKNKDIRDFPKYAHPLIYELKNMDSSAHFAGAANGFVFSLLITLFTVFVTNREKLSKSSKNQTLTKECKCRKICSIIFKLVVYSVVFAFLVRFFYYGIQDYFRNEPLILMLYLSLEEALGTELFDKRFSKYSVFA